jgi:uncharacterized phage protein gp47/JayE
MSDYGVTPEGFKTKRLPQLLAELNAAVKAIFGQNFNVSTESPDGQINGVISESNANLYEIAEEGYNAFNPSAATGTTLSNLVQLNGIRRQAATPSQVQLSIGGTPTTVIPVGSLVSTSDTGISFSTSVEAIIAGGGTVEVIATAVETGPLEATAGTITVIDSPVTGWGNVTNTSDAIIGTNEETDADLRARREQSIARDAQSIIDSIFAEILAVPAVTQLTVLENDTGVVDGKGLPPHSIYAIAVGGPDAAIAEAIFLKKPAGITSFGTTTIAVNDDQGIPHDINFSRPTEITIYVEVNLTTFTNYPVDGDTKIKQAVVDYANGILVEGRGFGLADDVIHSELYTPVNSIHGHTVDSLYIKITNPPTGSTADIPINIDEIASFDTSNIVINS